MTDFPSYAFGTVSVDAGGTVVTGTDTLWSGVNARAGDDITIAGHTVIVVDVTDETHLVIDAWPYDAVTDGTYKITQRSPLRFVGGQARADLTQLLATLKAKGLMWYLPDGLTEPDDAKPPLTADEGQVIQEAATGRTWVMQSGAWTFVGAYKALGTAAPWSSATAYNVNDVVSLNGTSYICILANTNHTPPNATYWVVLAAKGDTGDAATITVGTVTTGAAGSNVVVTNSGDEHDAVFDITIPRGNPGTGDMTSTNYASEYVGHESDVRDNLGFTTVGNAIATAADATAARVAISADTLPGHLWGLTLSNNATDSAADIDIAPGSCADDTGAYRMVLPSTLTKQIDASWAVGTNKGGRDTGSLTINTWHVFLIQRSDTGVVDALFSLSATSPTMPTNYDRKRRIGSVLQIAGTIRQFTQRGDYFLLKTAVTDYSATTQQAWKLQSVTTPSGIRVRPLLTGYITHGASVTASVFTLADGDDASTPSAPLWFIKGMYASDGAYTATEQVFTNTSAQIRLQTVFTGTATLVGLDTRGWVDTRGRTD